MWRQAQQALQPKLANRLDLSDYRLSDLQEFTEVCRGERIQRDLFRRQMTSETSYLRPTNNKDGSRPGKPANLYSLQVPPAED
jgi:hypothetical protein